MRKSYIDSSVKMLKLACNQPSTLVTLLYTLSFYQHALEYLALLEFEAAVIG
jgi:hypothetical protein